MAATLMPVAASLALPDFPALAVEKFSITGASQPPRTPCFALYLVEEGRGSLRVDYALHDYAAPALVCLSTYQKVAFLPHSRASGRVLRFHANFFCIETHHHAVGCNGVLFNEVYEVPLVHLDPERFAEFRRLMADMDRELREEGLAHLEVLVSSLKILLIRATRLKLAQQGAAGLQATRRPEALRRFREILESSYRHTHSPTEYARLLGIPAKALSQMVRTHFHKTVAEVIRDRVMKHAKWQLLHTLKPVKEVAYEVGFDDELYFSRLFKRSFGCAPMTFRDQETAVRGGSNLSM